MQSLDQDPEKAIRHRVNAPSTFSQKSINGGKMPLMMRSHGQNHLAHGVLSHGERPAYQKGHKDPVTRSAEASHESNLVNPERICYFVLQISGPWIETCRFSLFCAHLAPRDATNSWFPLNIYEPGTNFLHLIFTKINERRVRQWICKCSSVSQLFDLQ